MGDTIGAIRDYDVVIRLKPKNAVLTSAYVHRAIAKSKLGDNIGAIKDYDDTIRLALENTDFAAYIYSKRAAAKLEICDNIGAIEDCDTAVHLDPDLAEAYGIRDAAKSNLRHYTETV